MSSRTVYIYQGDQQLQFQVPENTLIKEILDSYQGFKNKLFFQKTRDGRFKVIPTQKKLEQIGNDKNFQFYCFKPLQIKYKVNGKEFKQCMPQELCQKISQLKDQIQKNHNIKISEIYQKNKKLNNFDLVKKHKNSIFEVKINDQNDQIDEDMILDITQSLTNSFNIQNTMITIVCFIKLESGLYDRIQLKMDKKQQIINLLKKVKKIMRWDPDQVVQANYRNSGHRILYYYKTFQILGFKSGTQLQFRVSQKSIKISEIYQKNVKINDQNDQIDEDMNMITIVCFIKLLSGFQNRIQITMDKKQQISNLLKKVKQLMRLDPDQLMAVNYRQSKKFLKNTSKTFQMLNFKSGTQLQFKPNFQGC